MQFILNCIKDASKTSCTALFEVVTTSTSAMCRAEWILYFCRIPDNIQHISHPDRSGFCRIGFFYYNGAIKVEIRDSCIDLIHPCVPQ